MKKRQSGSKQSIDTSPSLHSSLHRTTLPNGIRVMTEEVPTVESFALGVWIDSGTRDETPEQAGVAHFIEHAVFRRSTKRTSRQIAAQFESLGAYINAFTSKEQTCYYVRALSPHLARTTELLADVVLHPVFREDEIDKERNVILEEIKSYDDEPEEYILDIGERSLFGKHQLGSPIIGTAATVGAMKAKDLHHFHARHYTPDNLVVVAAGNVRHEELVRLVEKNFTLRRRKTEAKVRTLPKRQKARQIVVQRPFQQAHILFLQRTFGARSPQRYVLSLLNTILGDGMSSRLHQRIRERSGAAYTVYSSLQLLTDCGILSIYAGTESASVKKTETLIRGELRKLAEQRIPSRELQRAKEQLKSSTIMSLESMSARMQSLAKAELEEGIYEDIATTIAAIDAVSADDLNTVAQHYAHPEDWTSVLILPAG